MQVTSQVNGIKLAKSFFFFLLTHASCSKKKKRKEKEKNLPSSLYKPHVLLFQTKRGQRRRGQRRRPPRTCVSTAWGAACDRAEPREQDARLRDAGKVPLGRSARSPPWQTSGKADDLRWHRTAFDKDQYPFKIMKQKQAR